MRHPVAKSLATAAVSLVAILAIPGCGGAGSEGEPTGATGQAVSASDGCGGAAYEADVCVTSCPTGFGGGGTWHALPLGDVHQEACTQLCQCLAVTGTPDGGNPAWTSTGSSAPPAALSQCTIGRSLSAPSGIGVISGSIFACPGTMTVPTTAITPGYNRCVQTTPSSGVWVDPQGGSRCEVLFTGQDIDSTFVGNAISGWTLVEDLIVVSGTDYGAGGGIGGNCFGGCLMPH